MADPGHVACIPCSNNDCLHPICINAKLAKMKNMNAKGRRAGKRRTAGETVVLQKSGMESSTNEDERDLMWQDLLGVLEMRPTDENTNSGFSLQENSAHAILDGQNDPQEETINASQSHRWDHEMQMLGNESETQFLSLHSQIEENNLRSQCFQKSPCTVKSSKPISHTLVSVSQPSTMEKAGLNRYGAAAFSHNLQLRLAPLVANIRNVQHGANGSIESDIAQNPSCRIQCMRKLFGILSLIFQVFEGPCTAEVEEHYASALQKALDEIYHAKRLYE